MARAVRDFVGCKEEGDGLLPVTGNIPDMFSDSERLEINNFSKGGWQGGLPPALAGTKNASPRH